MSRTNSIAIKAIVVMGVGAFVLLGLVAAGLKGVVREDKAGGRRGGSRFAQRSKSPFDGSRAMADLQVIVGLGARPSGSEALAREREYIRQELTKAGIEVRELPFEAKTPEGPVPMVNVVGTVQGDRDGVILLGNHYDTKRFKEFVFVGANDGGSTAAWMIEMGRALGPRRHGRSVWLCFFDGEEAFVDWTESDSLYGSRAFVDDLRQKGELGQIQAMINVDMIGDCQLGIKRDKGAPEWLTQILWRQARELNYGDFFVPFGHSVEDDHVPFRRAGIPAVNLIDFCYGASDSDHARTWHTANDTIDRVCGASLQVIGDVIYHALSKVDAHLDKVPRE